MVRRTLTRNTSLWRRNRDGHDRRDGKAPRRPEAASRRDSVGALESFLAAKDSARARHDLAYLFWECTLRCNLECRHCGSDCLRDASTKALELPADRVCRELSAIARRYDPAA